MRHYPPRPATPGPATHNGYTPHRDRAAQKRFRALLLARAGARCEYPGCTATTDLQAHHDRPGYTASCGRLLCKRHHRDADDHAR